MKKPLHKTQQALLELLQKNMDDPLTIRELQEKLDISAPSVVFHHLQQLERKGYLKRNPGNARDYQILTSPDKPIVYLNQYGLAHCGPKGSILDGNPKERIPISSMLIKFPAEEAFLVEAKGDSMEPRIRAGDLVIAQKKKVADNGDMVVCVNNEEAIIKKYYRLGRQHVLHSENSKYPPFPAARDFKIEGVVRGIIQYS